MRPTLRPSTLAFWALSLSVTVGVFVYLGSHVSLTDVLQLLKGVDRLALLAFLILSLFTSALRTWRFNVALATGGYRADPRRLFFVVLVRNLFADLLPARIGTTVYIYLVNTRLRVPLDLALSSFSLSFLFDIFALAPLVLIALAGMSEIQNAALLFFAAVGIALASIAVLYALPRVSELLSIRLPSNWERLKGFLKDVALSLRKAERPTLWGQLLILSLAIRICKYGALYIFLYGLLRPLGFSFEDLPPAQVFFGLLAPEVAASLPASGIAGFGLYEGTWQYVFTVLGFPEDIAALTAISHHLFTQAYGYTLGALALLGLLAMAPTGKTEPKEYPMSFIPFILRFSISTSAAIVLVSALLLSTNTTMSETITQRLASPPPDQPLIEKVTRNLQGDILFDSNLNGTFGIYLMRPNGTMIRPIVDSEWQEMYPFPSLDGRFIAYSRSRTTARVAPSQVWIVERDGSNPRMITDDGAFPSFSSDGTKMYFERGRNSVFEITLDGTKEKQIFPVRGSGFAKYAVVKPRISPDGKQVAFTSDRLGRWNAWIGNIETGNSQHIFHGCEPTWIDNSRLAWVRTAEMESGTGISLYNREARERTILQDGGEPFGHEYFPSVVQDGEYLLYAQSPPDQHDHTTANYEISIKHIRSGQSARLTNLGATSRWPTLLPSRK